ncbi:calcium sensing receptor [Wolffia australiana]
MRTMMAARAASLSRPPAPSSSSSPTLSNKLDLAPRRFKSPILPYPSAMVSATSVSLLALFSGGFNEAKAFSIPKEDIMSSLNKVESTLDQVEAVSSQAMDISMSAVKIISDALKPAAEVVLPMMKKAGEEALKIASPVVSDASKQATEALQGAGVDPSSVIQTVSAAAKRTTTVIEGAKPIASSTMETISSSDPSVIAASAGALVLAYLLLPPVFSAISFNFRGYRGSLSPAQTLDLISSQQYLLIDIRSEKDKSKAGVPRLPSSSKNKLISIPLEELPSKIRNLVRDAKRVEAEMAALKISYLKRLGKGSNVVIMDSYSDSAKTVARVLTGLGFKNCWIMTDGFSGSKGWLQSRLGSDSYATSFVEVLSPSRIIPAARSFGTTSTSGKLLSGGVDG